MRPQLQLSLSIATFQLSICCGQRAMSVSVADLDVARQPAADAEAGRAALLKLLIDALVKMRREPIQDHDQLSRFRWEASCSSGSRPSLGALGIRWRLLRHSVAIADGPAQI